MIVRYLTKNNCYIKGQKHVPKGFMLHSTGANNPYIKRYVPNDENGLIGVNQYNNTWDTPTPGGTSVCVHGFIGKLNDGTVDFVQTLPWSYVGWHSGKGTKGSANYMGYVGVEICEDGLADTEYFKTVYNKAVEVVSDFCKQYNLNPLNDGVVICHSEGYKMGIASNHADVMHWFSKHGKTMDDFRKDVFKNMVEPNEWSKAARDWIVSSGIIAGYGNGDFGWSDTITREQLAVILYRFKEYMNKKGDAN